MDPGLIELFVDGLEDGLPDAGRLDELGLGSGSVVFMLHRLGWRWETCGKDIALSEDGLVATSPANMAVRHLVTVIGVRCAARPRRRLVALLS